MKKFLLSVLVVVTLTACKKDKVEEPEEEHTADLTSPVVTLNGPLENAIYFNTDTVIISGMVTDNELHSGAIEIKDDTTGQVYFTASPYVHGFTSAAINYSYIVNVIKDSKVTLTVTYEDHEPNIGQKIVHMTFKP
ncbi:MAG: hypothetical protein ACHQF2_00035 [Flavobacteriales bacterium]